MDSGGLPSTPKDELKWCYVVLNHTSRSFAVVINALGDQLRDAVCLFYLVLRALDTIEDDTTFPKDKKVPLLNSFHSKLRQSGWNMTGVHGTEYEVQLLANFNVVISCFSRLKQEYKDAIENIARRMGKGMSEFIEREVVTVKDWDLYCHYVAGLVGIGLSNIFANCGLEDPSFRNMDHISNSMGLFLQKTNIIRDYLEDINDNRIFWPKEIWSQYTNKLETFKEENNTKQAISCLNHLVTLAVEHIPDCLQYLSQLKDVNNFNFCAIPQIMAIGTLTELYQNHNVFTSVVKLDKETTMLIITTMDGMNSVFHWFYRFLNTMASKIDFNDPNCARLMKSINNSRNMIEQKVMASKL